MKLINYENSLHQTIKNVTKTMKGCFCIMCSYMYVWLHIVTHHSRFFLTFSITSGTDTPTHKYILMQTLNVCADSVSVTNSEIRIPSSISSRFSYVQYGPFTLGVGMDRFSVRYGVKQHRIPESLFLSSSHYGKKRFWIQNSVKELSSTVGFLT